MSLRCAMDRFTGMLRVSSRLRFIVALHCCIGLAWTLSFPLAFIRAYISCTRLAKFFRLRPSRYRGGFVVISGATGELGQEWARQLAAYGLNVCLLGRDPVELERLAEQLRQKHPDQRVETHAIDFRHGTDCDWHQLALRLESIPISMLINNAGASHRRFTRFEDTSLEEINNICTVNIIATLRLTKLIVPRMVEQRLGLIINVGSFGAHVPAPLLATYAGSKAFLKTWSKALAAQLEPDGVDVRYLNTYYITTRMSRFAPTWLIPKPDVYVKAALDTLGLACGSWNQAYVSTPYYGHSLIVWFADRFYTERLWLTIMRNVQTKLLAKSEARRAAKARSQ